MHYFSTDFVALKLGANIRHVKFWEGLMSSGLTSYTHYAVVGTARSPGSAERRPTRRWSSMLC